MVYISSLNLTTSMRQSVLQTQSDLSTAQKEVSSGVYADLGAQLGGQTATAISLAQQSGQLTTLTSANTVANNRLSATSSVIDGIMSNAQSLSNILVGNASNGTITAADQTQIQSSLQSMLGGLNTAVAGQYIFAGTNTTNAPMVDYATTQSTVDGALAQDLPALATNPSSITAADINNAVSSSGNFGALYQNGSTALSSASSTTITSQISPSQNISTSISAKQSAFQNIAQAYSLLSELGGKGLNADANQAMISAATQLLNKGIAGLTTLQASVGTTQNSITNANSQMTAQQTILTNNVASLEQVDTYTLSTRVTALQTQLQDAYSLTNQLKSLSLVNYLTGG